MGYLEGLLGGFVGRKREVEQENIRQADLTNQRESKIFEALLNSGDPETVTLATAGLLDSATGPKKKGGLRGWLGEMQSSPYLEKIRALSAMVPEAGPGAAPGAVGTPPTAAAPMVGQVSIPEGAHRGAAAAEGSLAQADTAATQGGPITMGEPTPAHRGPAVAPVASAAPAPAGPVGAVLTGQAPTPRMVPRHVFPTQEEQILTRYSTQERAELEGVIKTLTPYIGEEAAVKQALAERARARGVGGAAGMQSIAGEMPDGTPAFGVFDRAQGKYLDPNSGQPLEGFRPRTTSASKTYGADRESISMEPEFGGIPYARQSPEGAKAVNAEAIRRTRDVAYQRGTGAGQARVETELNMPIGPTAAQLYNVAPTTRLSDLSDTIGLDPVQKQRVYALGQIDTLIENIDTLLPKVFPNVDPGISGTIRTAMSLGMQRLAHTEDLASLDASINASLAQVAQLAGQPGSRLSDKDIEIARSTLASLTPGVFSGDTLKTAQARLNVIKQLLEKARASVPTSPQVGAKPPGSQVGAAPPAGTAPRPTTVKQGNAWVIQIPK